MKPCPFCDPEHLESTEIHSYAHWILFLHTDDKRSKTKYAAGFVALKRHTEYLTDCTDEEWSELRTIIKDSSKRLCSTVSATYLDQETVGFNQGEYTGQTVPHAHVHIFPVTEEDPVELRYRGGMSGAFEELRKARLSNW